MRTLQTLGIALVFAIFMLAGMGATFAAQLHF